MITPLEFGFMVEQLVQDKGIDYLEACMSFMEKHNLEVEDVISLVKKNQNIKSKLRSTCQELNLVEKEQTLL